MKQNLIARLGIAIVVIATILSLVNYAGDLIINFKYSLENITYLGFYFIDFLIFHSWLFSICIIIYYYFFKFIRPKHIIVWKSLFGITIGYIVSTIIYKDEVSLNIHFKEFKIPFCYSVTGLLSVLTMELLIIPKWFIKRYSI